MSLVHVHAPAPSIRRVLCGNCPDCKQRSRFLAFFTEWYGWDKTCLKCGRQWQDGHWSPLPSHRYARRDSIAAAKKVWRNYTQQGTKEAR